MLQKTMKLSVPDIVLAAKQREIDELKRLASKAQLVGGIGHLIHALQSERGASSIFLASSGARFAATRLELIGASQSIESSVRTNFEMQLENASFGNAKIFSLMAWALLGLDALPELRQQITDRKLSAYEAVAAISRLVAGLISLLFELADTAINPGISRLLVAYFNFVQGKELAGQERAVGALCFASGLCDGQHQQRVLHLIDAQERSFQVFLEFAAPHIVAQWQDLQVAPYVAQLERLRRVLSATKPGAKLDANQSDAWFDCCSERLANMWSLQCALVDLLQENCATLIADAEHDQLNAEGLLKSLRENPPASTDLIDRFFDPEAPVDHALAFVPSGGIRAPSEISMMEMLQAQSERLAQMESELGAARRALNERKTIERAKGILMARLNLSEEEAYKTLRKTAMDQNRRVVDVAEATLSLLDLIAPQPNN
jgi:hypothetical protein